MVTIPVDCQEVEGDGALCNARWKYVISGERSHGAGGAGGRGGRKQKQKTKCNEMDKKKKVKFHKGDAAR